MTNWLVVSPVDFKKYIQREISSMRKKDEAPELKRVKSYSDWSTCSICKWPYFPDPFDTSTVEEIAKEQEVLVQHMKGKAKLNEYQKQLL